MSDDVAVFLDATMTIACSVVVGGVVIARRLAARRRFYAGVLHRLAPILEASPSEVAMLLGTTPDTLERWYAHGVPEASHGDIIRLLRTAVLLRACLAPSTTRQLLLLRQRRISQTVCDYQDLLASRRNRAHSSNRIIITVR